MAGARRLWKSELQQRFDPEKLVFIDATGTATNMARQRGRCRRGARLIGRVPHGHWKTTTLAAGLRSDAVTAPFVIDQAMNGRIFRTLSNAAWFPSVDAPLQARENVGVVLRVVGCCHLSGLDAAGRQPPACMGVRGLGPDHP